MIWPVYILKRLAVWSLVIVPIVAGINLGFDTGYREAKSEYYCQATSVIQRPCNSFNISGINCTDTIVTFQRNILDSLEGVYTQLDRCLNNECADWLLTDYNYKISTGERLGCQLNDANDTQSTYFYDDTRGPNARRFSVAADMTYAGYVTGKVIVFSFIFVAHFAIYESWTFCG